MSYIDPRYHKLMIAIDAALASESLRNRFLDRSRIVEMPGSDIVVGGSGDVRPASYMFPDGTSVRVAVKSLRPQGSWLERLPVIAALIRELRVWGGLQHPNVLYLGGFYYDVETIDCASIVTLWQENGNVLDHIRRTKPDEGGRLKLALDTARGLHYLHTLQPPVCHADIKPENTLVDSTGNAMLCDFGLARMLEDEPSGLTSTGLPKLTLYYASPELLNNVTRHTLKSDVWAWGCLFFGIVTDLRPYRGYTDISVVLPIAQGRSPADLKEFPRPEVLPVLLERCWQPVRETRPTMGWCMDVLSLHTATPFPVRFDTDRHVTASEYKTVGGHWHTPARLRVPSPPPRRTALSEPSSCELQLVPTLPAPPIADPIEWSTPGWKRTNIVEPGPGKPIPDEIWTDQDKSGSAQPTWDPQFGSYSYQNAASNDSDISENRWWDMEAMASGRPRPGRGLLPPAIYARLIGPQISLFKVSVTIPDFVPDPPLPATEDVLASVPHRHAQWDPSKYAWVYHQAKMSVRLPQVFLQPGTPPLPNSASRKARLTCVNQYDTPMSSQAIGLANFRTHHFHYYPKCVKGSTLNPPFTDKFAPLRSRQSRGKKWTANAHGSDDEILLDLYVCCQCQTHFIASGPKATIPMVVKVRRMREYVKDRQDHPSRGRSPDESVVWALEMLSQILEHLIFKLNTQPVKIGHSFTNRMGWNTIVRELFLEYGFEHQSPSSSSFNAPFGRLVPPSLDPGQPGAQLRHERLLLAWLELNVVLADYKHRYEAELAGYKTTHKVWVTLKNTQDEMKRMTGAFQIKRTLSRAVEDSVSATHRKYWEELGLTPDKHSSELVEYGYRRQIYCDPIETPVYFEALYNILHWAMGGTHSSKDGLSNFVGLEIRRGVWAIETLRDAAVFLGLTHQSEEGSVSVAIPDDPDPELLRDSWLKKMGNLNADFAAGRVKDQDAFSQRKYELKEAYRIVSEGTGKAQVVTAYEEALKMYGSMGVGP